MINVLKHLPLTKALVLHKGTSFTATINLTSFVVVGGDVVGYACAKHYVSDETPDLTFSVDISAVDEDGVQTLTISAPPEASADLEAGYYFFDVVLHDPTPSPGSPETVLVSTGMINVRNSVSSGMVV